MSIFDWLSQALFSACGVEPTPVEPGTVLSTFDWMEQSAVGSCVMQTPMGFYILLAIHSVGLAVIVGVMLVISLRLLGVARGISAGALPKLITLGWWGFWINAVSGISLFIGEANKMFGNTTFRWKLFLIFVGMTSAYILNKTILKPAAAGDLSKLDSSSAKNQAYFSIFIWLAVITTGRMIAYITDSGL
jgi:hypothetical protein